MKGNKMNSPTKKIRDEVVHPHSSQPKLLKQKLNVFNCKS